MRQVRDALGTAARWSGRPLRTHLDQVRRLDLPVVLEMFHPARRDTCYVALLRLEGDEAVVVARGRAAAAGAACPSWTACWTRQAIFLWRDFER